MRAAKIGPASVAASLDNRFCLALLAVASHIAGMHDNKPKIEFRPTMLKSGREWYVQVKFFDAPPLQIGSFLTEADAKEWITSKSAAWRGEYREGRYA